MSDPALTLRRFDRERRARQQAEALLEQKSLELYESNEQHRRLAEMMAEREAKTRAVLEELRLRRFLMEEHAIVSEADAHGRITYVSNSFCRISGYSREELLGQDHRIINSGHHPREFWEEMYTTLARDGAWHNEVCNRAKDGSLYWVYSTNVVSKDDDNRITGYISLQIDNTRQKQAEADLLERAGLAALEKDVGIALTRGGCLREVLQQCCEAVVQRTDAAFARIWSVNDQEQMLELQASAGMYTHIDGGHARVPIGKFKIGLIAQEREPHLTNDVQNDPRVGNPEWALREGMIAFAGHPLIDNDQLVGVMALFARHALSDAVIGALSSVSDAIALGIQRKRAEVQLEAVHRQLLDTSRRAGMAEIATSVLHNVGNVLNSVNVSSTVIAEAVRNSRIPRLSQAADLIQSHADRLGEFFLHDEKGRQLPGYLVGLAKVLCEERKLVADEIGSLSRNIEHIKSIVSTQQTYARVSGVDEAVDIREVVDDALRMSSAAFERHHIEVVREHCDMPTMVLNRQELLQILVNLTRNAKEAICERSAGVSSGERSTDRRLTIQTNCVDCGRLVIKVIDTGTGIAPENLTRIFAHGFTTKKDGHGFGLHSSALAAQEMGGTLRAYNNEAGPGAQFVLELPLRKEEPAG